MKIHEQETKVNDIEGREVEKYREKIVEMIKQIDNKEVLKKIYTVVKTHMDILNE